MAILDFPNAPTVGQVATLTNGFSYQWDGTVWVLTASLSGVTAGGDLTGVYPNPSVTPAAKSKWTTSGTALAPTDTAVSIVNVPAATFGLTPAASTVLKLAPRGTILADNELVDIDANGANSQTYDRNGSPTWKLRIQSWGGDVVLFLRRAPNTDTYVTQASISSLGNLLIAGNTATKAAPGTAWVNPCDRRLKKNITDDPRGLDAILGLRPVLYQFNGLAGTADDGLTHHGLIADEVAPIMPEAVGTMSVKLKADDAKPADVLTLDVSNVAYALINAVKELAARVATLEGAA